MGCVLAARPHLFYIGFDKDFLGRLFLRWPAWSIMGHVVLPASLTDVTLSPLAAGGGTPGTNPHGGGHRGLSAGEIGHHVCQPLGSLGEAVLSLQH